MPTAIPDLWPTDFGVVTMRPPVQILREQAALLGQKTQNIVLGEVESSTQGNWFTHNLYLRAPALSGYRYLLFSVKHSITLYPLYAADPDDRDMPFEEPDREIDSEEEFIGYLKKVFSHQSTQRVVQALIAQSQT